MSVLDLLRRMDVQARERSLSGIAISVVAVFSLLLLIMSAPVAQNLQARKELLLESRCVITELDDIGDSCTEDDCEGFYVKASLKPLEESGTITLSNGDTLKVVPNVEVAPMLRRGRKASESGGGNKMGLMRLLGDLKVGEELPCWYEIDDCAADECFATLSENVGATAMIAIATMWALFFACCGLTGPGTLLVYCCCKRRR